MGRYTKVYEAAIIYGLFDPRNGQLHYIGQTVTPLRQRLSTHLCQAGWGEGYWKDDPKQRWIAGLVAEGLRPEMDVLEDVPLADADSAEKFWILYFASIGCQLYNHRVLKPRKKVDRAAYRAKRKAEYLARRQRWLESS